MVRRSRLEIYFDVLEIIERGINKPTQVMYKTNLSWAPLQEILESLISGGFLREEDKKNSKRYYITEKGKNALGYYLKSLDYMKSLDGLIQIRQGISR